MKRFIGDFLTEKMRRGLPQQKRIEGVDRIIVVGSGKGGVGKSTVAVGIALALSRTHRVGLLDADIHGPSIPRMLGISAEKSQALQPVQVNSLKVMSMGLLSSGPVVWRGLMVTKALQQMLFQVPWGLIDYLIVDLPPGTGDIHLSVIQSVLIDSAILVSTPQLVALDDVLKASETFKITKVPILGYVENMSYACCPNCSHSFSVFPHEANVPLRKLISLPISPKVSQEHDQGMPSHLDQFDDLAKIIQNEIHS
jgi:ATP-binding protein involved in chromosome partitioning